MAAKRRDEVDWPVVFGSATLLLVLILGFLAGVPLQAVVIRALLAAFVGVLIGLLVSEAARGFKHLVEQPATGRHVDWVIADDLPEGAEPFDAPVVTQERTVPQAAGDGFTPIDFKHQAPQVRSMKSE